MTIETRTLDQLPENQGVIGSDQVIGTSYYDPAFPNFTFSESPTTGLYTSGLNVASISANGVLNTDFRQTQTNFYQPCTHPSGTAAAPSLAVGNNVTGIYSPAVNTLSISTSGAQRLSVSATATSLSVPIYLTTGTAAAPGLAFTASTDTGFFTDGLGGIGIATSGVQRVLVNLNGVTASGSGRFISGPGTAGAPIFSPQNGPGGMGMYSSAAQTLAFSTASNVRLQLNSSSMDPSVPIRTTTDGSVSAPAYSWSSDNNTGLYRIGADNLGIACSGAQSLDISTSRVLVPLAGTQTSPSLAVGGATYGMSLSDGLTIVSNAVPRMQIQGPHTVLTNTVSKDILSLAWGGFSGSGSITCTYQVNVDSAAGYQVECGELRITYTNNAGAYLITATKVSSQQELSSGTLTVSFASVAAASSLVSVTATTSLGTPSLYFYGIWRPLQRVNNVPTLDFTP